MDRTILHSDCNCFYASVEMLHHPELSGKPVAVGGDPEARHGIVLTANDIAKGLGVKTGMVLWQAKQLCPDIIFLPPRMDLYLRFSRMAHEIYAEYTDRQEPFGIDECWLDCTDSISLKGEGRKIAEEISRRIKRELGITVSIGVSWNKIFAKLGSDYQKPDAITEITKENYKTLAWKLPVKDLLYVGRSTQRKLRSLGVYTIGELANFPEKLLENYLGKMGLILHSFANGWDESPVFHEDYRAPIKSIGNSTTTPRALVCDQDVRIVLMTLAESVSARLRENGFRCNVVEISVRDENLCSFTRQKKLSQATNITNEIAEAAWELFRENYAFRESDDVIRDSGRGLCEEPLRNVGKRYRGDPIRSLGVRGCDLVTEHVPIQLDLFQSQEKKEKQQQIDRAVDEIRRRFGYYSIQRAIMYQDNELSHLDAKSDHIIHPQGYFH